MNAAEGALLLVDDCDKARELFARRLRDRGFEVHEAAGGIEALEIVRDKHLDLVLLDVVMPGLSGQTVLERIRDRHALLQLPVIMLTAQDTTADLVGAFERGANDYIVKPPDFEVALARIRTQVCTKRTEDRCRHALRDLARSNQELEHFAMLASHDLQEPLRVVQSFLGLIDDRCGDRLGDEGKEFLGFAADAAARMQAMVRGLLAFCRVGRSERPSGRVSLEDVVDHALANLAVTIRDTGARIDREPLPAVRGDAVMLTELFQNLLCNALKFRAGQPVIRIRARESGGHIVVQVEDNGIGIPADQQPRLFKLFQRLNARSRYPGTGIGLALCRSIAELHGGAIGVRSQPGEGTTFEVQLPPAGVALPTDRGGDSTWKGTCDGARP